MSDETFISHKQRADSAVVSVQALMLGFLFSFVAFAEADTVYLRSGEKVIGKIISDEKKKLVIKSELLGKLELKREDIERVEFDPTPGDMTNTVSTATSVNTNTLAPIRNTNTPALLGPLWKPTVTTNGWKTDWIQLTSGEWLRGRLYGMHNHKLEFESDKLKDLVFDWNDVNQVIVPEALVSYGDREVAWGSVQVDREKVTVNGAEEVTFPRYDLIGLAPGRPRELDYWSGRFGVGLNLSAGNSEEVDLFLKAKIERRTPNTHLKLEYVGNYSELHGAETVNNQWARESFDYFLTRRFFLRLPQAEYYMDPFQNIDYRITVGGGVGYYLIDKPKTEWLVSCGPAYNTVRFDTVPPGRDEKSSTPAGMFQSRFKTDLNKRTELELDYQIIVGNEDSGGLIQRAAITWEIDLTHHLDLDLSFIWDRITYPQTDAAGVTPKPDDFRLNLSLGVKF
jgi:hypothetical protein